MFRGLNPHFFSTIVECLFYRSFCMILLGILLISKKIHDVMLVIPIFSIEHGCNVWLLSAQFIPRSSNFEFFVNVEHIDIYFFICNERSDFFL